MSTPTIGEWLEGTANMERMLITASRDERRRIKVCIYCFDPARGGVCENHEPWFADAKAGNSRLPNVKEEAQ